MAGQTESDRIRAQMANPIPRRDPIQLDGRPLAQALADDAYTSQIHQEVLAQREADRVAAQNSRQIQTEAEAQRLADLLRRDYDIMPVADRNRRMAKLREWRTANPTSPAVNPEETLIASSPVPTGIDEIDLAGQTIRRTAPHTPTSSYTYKSLDEYAFDDPMVIRAQNAAEGVDYRKGLPFYQRAKIAFSPSAQGGNMIGPNGEVIEESPRSQRIREVLGQNFEQIPFDLPLFRYDPVLEEFHIMTPDPENDGKYRWTAMDGAGIELGDLGDMMNLGEIGSVTGGIAGTFIDPTKGTSRVLGLGKRAMTFWRKSPGGRAAFGGFSGGMLGRNFGDAAQYAIWYQKTGQLPTYDQLKKQGWDNTQIEAFATVMGEAGAKILRSASTGVQDLFYTTQGKRGVFGTQQHIDVENANLRQTQEDLNHIANVLGREDLPVTQGTATGSIDIIEAENFGFANASRAVQRELNKAMARGKRTVSDYINAVFGGRNPIDTEKAILDIGDTITAAGTFTAQTADGTIHVANKLNPELGLKWETHAGTDHWVNKGARLKTVDRVGNTEGADLTGFGMGAELYRISAKEAATYGKGIASGDQVSESALEGIWRKIDGDPAVGTLEWTPINKLERLEDGSGNVWFRTTDGTPVVKSVPPRYTDKLLDEYLTPTQRTVERSVPGTIARTRVTQGGKRVDEVTGGQTVREVEETNEFARFLRRPLRQEKGQVVEEIKTNPWSRQRLQESIYEDYLRSVRNADGTLNPEKFAQWKQEVGPNLDGFFTPEELLYVTKPGALRQIVENNRIQTDAITMQMSRELKIPMEDGFWKDPSVTSVWNQLKKLDGSRGKHLEGPRMRTMRLLDQVGMGDAVRARFMEDLRLKLLQNTKAANATGFNVWMKDNAGLIDDVLGPQYGRDLEVLSNVLQRRSDRGMVKGVGADVNPTMLGLTRVIFGPLSRAQRGFSAARRGQVRSGAAKAADIVTNPNMLRELMRIRPIEVESRVAARVIQDAGGWEIFGDDILGFIPTGGSEFDADNPAHRKAVADYVVFALAQDEELNVERQRVADEAR